MPTADGVAATADSLFDGPGEMRERLRNFDWASSPLGPVHTWPIELMLMMRTCLNSGFGMSVHWGPELTVLYNDAFIPLMGPDKHPAMIGRPSREVWAEEWGTIGSLMDRVISQGEAVKEDDLPLVLQRSGYREECYFQFSYSPIDGADGRPAGLFNISTETTRQILSERRLNLLTRLGLISATQSDTAAGICRSALEVVSNYRRSIPFGAVLLQSEDGPMELAGSFGLAGSDADRVLSGELVEVAGRVMAEGSLEVIKVIDPTWAQVLTPGPIGPALPEQAAVLPLVLPGESRRVGALVLAISPYRRFDDAYRDFFNLIARQIGVAVGDTVAFGFQRERARALVQVDRAKTEFFQNVSHELRTPLTLLLAPLQDLLDKAENLDPVQSGQIGTAVRAAQRLQRMVDSLLDFSRSEAGNLTPRRDLTDLVALTKDTADIFRPSAETKGLAFKVDLGSSPLVAITDPTMWTTILANLLGNALKFTALGRIDLRLTSDGSTVTLTVSDTGQGIRTSEQRRIFERFYRSAEAGGRSGAGIGLSLVSELVSVLDGSIEVVSAPGQGSTFVVTVPLGSPTLAQDPVGPSAGSIGPDSVRSHLAVLAPAVDTRTEPTGPAMPDHGSPHGQLILVEDDPDLRLYLQRLLVDDGWQVRSFADAETAADAMTAADNDGACDVLLTDIQLPGRSGLELIRELRVDRAWARIPMIALTARGGPQAAVEGMEAGADDYVVKPFDSGELLARVRANVELFRLREAAVERAERKAGALREGLESNRTVGTATGLIMSTYRLDAARSFQVLVAASQTQNVKLRDVAEQVVATGGLPFRQTVIDDLLLRVADSS